MVFSAAKSYWRFCVFYHPLCGCAQACFFLCGGRRVQRIIEFQGGIIKSGVQTGGMQYRIVYLCIPLLLSLSLVTALWIYRHSRVGSFLKTGFLIPMAIPVAAVVLLWQILFDGNGLLNGALDALGLPVQDWMGSRWAFAVLVFSYIWKNIGYHVVLWLAGLSMIPDQIYEAARMDGASESVIFFRITLPNLLPMLFIIVVLALINSFKVFREVYLVAGNYPHESIYMIQHLFNNWFRDLALDKMAAGAVLLSLALIALTALLRKAWEDRI